MGLSSCSQGPAKPCVLRCSAKRRCQTATGARPPVSSRAILTIVESQALLAACRVYPSFIQIRNIMYKTFGETAQVSPNVVLRLHQDHAQTERLYLTHHGSYCSPYLCQPNRAAKKHGAQLTEGNEQELLVCCRVIITLSAAWLLGECPSKTRSRWAGAASRELGRALRARLPPSGLLPALPGVRQAPRARHGLGSQGCPGALCSSRMAAMEMCRAAQHQAFSPA